MAIEKYHVESKEDLLSILQGMKDINDNPFFESVVMEQLSGAYVIRFKEEVEGVATIVISWTVTGSSSNLGRVRVDYKNADQSFSTILCPFNTLLIFISRDMGVWLMDTTGLIRHQRKNILSVLQKLQQGA